MAAVLSPRAGFLFKKSRRPVSTVHLDHSVTVVKNICGLVRTVLGI